MTSVNALHKIISEILRIAPGKITPDIGIHQLDTWNSLTHIELVISIEERFHIQLTADEIVAMTTIGGIQRILSERGMMTP